MENVSNQADTFGNMVPNGFTLHRDFITEQEEIELLSQIQHKSEKRNQKGRSSIKRFGAVVYTNSVVSEKLPDWAKKLGERLVKDGHLKTVPNHTTVNKYNIGDNIGPHYDKKEAGDVISIISLLSDATMVFSKNKEREEVLIPRRSLVLMSGESRWDWKHEILRVEHERYSIVMREKTEIVK